AEDGIRDFHVTGVQTCALPISNLEPMEPFTVLLIVLAVLATLTLVWLQYFHKNPRKGSTNYILAALRFISILSGLLLLIAPTFVDREVYLEKADLILLVDRSTSMGQVTDPGELSDLVDKFRTDPGLRERFNIHQYGFGSNLMQTDSLAFDQGNTDIANALYKTNGLFVGGAKTMVLFTDGNQTLGRDYGYFSLPGNPQVHPVILGDTTQFEDISIGLVNANNYAF